MVKGDFDGKINCGNLQWQKIRLVKFVLKPTLLRNLLLCFGMIHFISNAQSPFNCDINVPSNQVNFLDTYSSAIINFTTVNQGAGYQCCSQPANMTCETFTVNTFASNIAFNITTGQNFNGNSIVIHVNNCSTPLNMGDLS